MRANDVGSNWRQSFLVNLKGNILPRRFLWWRIPIPRYVKRGRSIAFVKKGSFIMGYIRRLFEPLFHLNFDGFRKKIWDDHLKEWIERNVRVKLRQRHNRLNLHRRNNETVEYLSSHFCTKPFTDLETTPSGLAYVCCPGWLPTPIGSIETDLVHLWSGPMAQKIRASIIDGSFRYCNHTHCPAISNKFLLDRNSIEAQSIIKKYSLFGSDAFPAKYITLSHDRSCNLSCPSCRSTNIIADKAKQKKLDDLIETAIIPILRTAETVNITGSGDPFGSNHFRRLIQRLNKHDFPNLKIDLHSNGQLWDERAWLDLGLSGRVRYVQISIDAAEADTYSVVRRGGDFKRLRNNLAFIKRLRKSGEIASLEFSMVVQARNFREMPNFVRLGQEFSADAVSFQMIRNWGTFSDEEFRDEFVGSPEHSEHRELIGVLSAPELALPLVRIGNILAHVGQGS